MRWAYYYSLILINIMLWMLWPTISRTFTELNSTSLDGNSTAPINPWSLFQTFLTSPSFFWLLPLFVVACLVIKIVNGSLSSDNDVSVEGHIPMVGGEDEEEEEELAQITPTGGLQDLRCPKCSAPLHFQRLEVTTICAYCGLQVQRRTDG